MLDTTQLVEQKWNARNKRYYVDLGYTYTKMGDTFLVKYKDLTPRSTALVELKCDHCGKIMKVPKLRYEQYANKEYGDYCGNCKHIKAQITNTRKYGMPYLSQVKEFREKAKETCMERYGSFYAEDNPILQEKRRQTCLERYGVEWYSQTKEYKETYKNTCQQRYGTDNVFQSDIIKERIRQTMQNKYGVDNPSQCPKIHAKAMGSFCRDGGQKSSKQQDAVSQMLLAEYGNCELNKVVDFYVADCLLTIDDIVIDVEYDGWYWHQNSQKRDKQRDGYMYSKGYKVLRIKGGVEIPTIAQLQNAINRLLDDEQYVEIILDWKN